jgi:hypothetical protein
MSGTDRSVAAIFVMPRFMRGIQPAVDAPDDPPTKSGDGHDGGDALTMDGDGD